MRRWPIALGALVVCAFACNALNGSGDLAIYTSSAPLGDVCGF